MKHKIYFIFIFIVLFGLSVNISYAQETARPVEVNGDHVEYFPKEKKLVGAGNIYVDYGDVTLTCDKITVYTDTKDADAEGNVVLKTLTSQIRGERVRYNFATKKGEVLKIKVRSGEWYGGSEKAELLPDGSVRTGQGYITSCDLDEPHYRINSKSILIYPDNRIVANNVLFMVGNTPIAYLPKYNYSLDTDWPSIDLIPGKKKKWGVFALTSYRYRMDNDNRLTLRIDEREKWGLGQGLDYKYNLSDFGQGLLRTYYTHQRDRDRDSPIRAEEERYRMQLRHRWDIDDNVTGLLEYHKLSDVDMTKDFFYREEYDRESSPESYLYLLNAQPEYSMGFLTRKRVNHFQTIVERLPELRFNLKDQRLSDDVPLYFKTDTALVNLTSKTANNSTDSDVIRFDTDNKLSSPLRLAGFLSVSPFVGMRDTFYSKDINGNEDEFRTAFYTGMDMSSKISKTYGLSGRFLGVEFNKLHHIITPSVEYEYIHGPSMTSSSLQQFDAIDAIARKSTFGLGLENKIQTKRLIDNKLTTVDLGYLLLTGDYLYKPENGSQMSDVKADLELTPYEWLRIESDTQYNPATRDFENWNTDLFINKSDWRLGLGSRYWQDTEHELTSEVFYKLNDIWSFRLFGRYDLKEVEADGNKIVNRFDTKELTIIKDLHCWLAEASVDIGRDGGTTVWLALKLKASPKAPFDFKDYYAVPKR